MIERRDTGRRPPAELRFQPRAAVWLLALLLLGAGCRGHLRFEGETSEVVVQSLDEADCPPGWSGDELPAALRESLESALTTVLAEIGIQAQSELDRRNAGVADSVQLVSLSLQMTDTSSATSMQSSFGFLRSLTVFVESSEPDSPLPRIQVAESSFVPAEATVVPLLVDTTAELHPYVREGAKVVVEAEARSCLTHAVRFRAVYIAKVRPEP